MEERCIKRSIGEIRERNPISVQQSTVMGRYRPRMYDGIESTLAAKLIGPRYTTTDTDIWKWTHHYRPLRSGQFRGKRPPLVFSHSVVLICSPDVMLGRFNFSLLKEHISTQANKPRSIWLNLRHNRISFVDSFLYSRVGIKLFEELDHLNRRIENYSNIKLKCRKYRITTVD